MNHYVYQINWGESFYIGVRSCGCEPEYDPYMGSGAFCRTVTIAGVKKIISEHETRDQAEVAEALLIHENWGNPFLRNRHKPVVKWRGESQSPENGYVREPSSPRKVGGWNSENPMRGLLLSNTWLENSNCRVLWITIMASMDSERVCQMSIPAMCHIVGIQREECAEYLKKFEDPDPYALSLENEGRRLLKIDGGWLVLSDW